MGITILKSELTDEYTEGYTPVYSATKEDKYFGYLENPKLLLQKDDLIIPARGNSIGHVKIAHEIVSTTQTTIYSRINQEIAFPKFIYYVSLGMKDIWFDFTNTAIPQITVNQINNNELYLPTMIKQKKICKILDGKIGNINDIIFLTKCSIEELKKYKQSLITEVVTKGLDKNVEMKDSGIEWIGEIPKEWITKKLKYIVNLRDEKTLDVLGCRYIGLEHIESMSGQQLNYELWDSETVEKVYKKGDVLYSKLRPYLAKSIIAKDEGICSGELLVFKDIEINKAYLNFILISANFTHYINSTAYGTKMPRSSWAFIKEVYIPIPEIREQERIVEHLNTVLASADKLVNDKNEIINEYESYKKSLIYEYVTGKKEVGEEEK